MTNKATKKATPKITPEEVTKIKQAIVNGEKHIDIAKQFGISRTYVSDIASGRRQGNVPWPAPTKRFDPTDKRIQELESEVLHLTEERNRERQRARANAKTEGLFQAMASVMEKKIPAFKPLPHVKRNKTSSKVIEEHAVLHLSDGHHDQIITPTECGGLEKHDFQVACCRAERLVDTVIQWTQETLSDRFRFPVLNILSYGDHTSGEIHGAATRSYFKQQMRNCLAIGQLHAAMYRDLAPHFDQIHVFYVPGNHGRRTPKKDYHGAHDNWDYLIAEISKLYCQNIENVSFCIPNSFSVNLDINGVGFNISHGDDVRSQMGIPWYGLQRRQQRIQSLAPLQAGPRVRYCCVGHFHQKGMVGSGDTELIMNGPWIATDAYAYESFGAYTEPFQWLHGVNPKYGISWRLGVKVKDQEREVKGPQRYKIHLESE